MIMDAHSRYVSDIFTTTDNEPDPTSPGGNKANRFWSFVKSLKKDASGITSFRENGILKTETTDKVNICNDLFQSAFTGEPDRDLPCPVYTRYCK